MSRALRAALDKLYRADGGQLAASALSSAQRQALDAFASQTGSITMRRSGRGVVYHIRHAALVEQRWRELCPSGAAALDPELPARARNIARRGASKSAAHTHPRYYLMLRAGPGAVLWQDDDGQQLDLSSATHRFGGALLAIEDDNPWHSSGPLWLVENQALFDRLDWLSPEPGSSVAWYRGQLPNTLISWLAARPRASTVYLFPDYDGIGLLNYARLKTRLGTAVQLWLMPDWAERLQRFGSNTLWQDSQREFNAALRMLTTLPVDPPLEALIRTMDEQGRGLEQEAVWLPLATTISGAQGDE